MNSLTARIACISEIYLDSSVAADDKDFSIKGYNLIITNYPSNQKRGGVCIYHKESLAFRLVKLITSANVYYVKSLLITKRITLGGLC